CAGCSSPGDGKAEYNAECIDMKRIWDLRFTIYSLKKFLLLLIEVVIFASCNIINPASPVPSYIRIESIKLTTDNATQGSNRNAITDVWVYVDQQMVGVFEMPVTVPVLYSGVHTVMLKAGIIVDGIASTRIDYPFYNSFTQEVNLQ